VGEDGQLRLLADDGVAQDKVLVRNRVGSVHLDACLRLALLLDARLVLLDLEILDGHAGVELDGQADVVPVAEARLEDRRRDPRSVGHAVRVRRPARSLRVLVAFRRAGLADLPLQLGRDQRRLRGRAAGNEPRADDHREVKIINAHVVLEHVDVRDLDHDLLLRLDVPDRLRENVRPFLFEERGRPAVPQRAFIDRPRGGPALDDAHDPAVADDHRHVIDRGLVRQRKDVDRLDLLVQRVVEPLPHLHAGDEAGYRRLHVRVLERARDDAAVLHLDPQLALPDTLVHRRLLGRRLNCRREYHDRRHNAHNTQTSHGQSLRAGDS